MRRREFITMSANGTKQTCRDVCLFVRFRREAGIGRSLSLLWSDANDPSKTLSNQICCDARRGISYHGVVGCNPQIEGNSCDGATS